MIRRLWVSESQSIQQAAGNNTQLKAYYRFFENEKTTEDAIMASMNNRCGAEVRGKAVLIIQDTTEISLYNNNNRIEHDDTIGVTNAAENGPGFMLHLSLQ